MASVTPNLKLRLADDLTTDATFNLNKIDSLGSSTLVDNTGNLRIRALSDIQLQPQSSDIGGSGSGGTITLGESGSNITKLDIHSTDIDLNASSLNIESGLLKFTDGTNFIAFQKPSSFSGNTTYTVPEDGSSGQVLSTDGSGSLSWATVAGSSLNTQNIEVGNPSNIRTSVDTNSVGDILADSTNGLTIKAGSIIDSDINSSAGISLSKLSAVTAERALVSDVSGFMSASSVTATELGYLSGVTSNIQSQINALGGANQLVATWANADGTSKTITHGFGTRNVDVEVIDESNDFISIEVESITRPNDNQVVLSSNQAPQSNWRVLIFQIGS